MVPVLHFSSSTWFSVYHYHYEHYYSQSASVPLTTGVSQGSAPGPIKFIEDTSDISETFPVHSLQYNMFADNTQMYSLRSLSGVQYSDDEWQSR